ncbi:LysR substrate-binding domain-containing protein [Mangrovicoccus algicola]|uniref:LysR family transcriptional regulator n=1 Tax=Mangrovicoccus algicola TaxID=2771008 RepID=A0A8J6YUF1_9RHOB|nr:LysR substrate-binding domain-containing protein [Mangrovicoccus algicola]MBE3637967.1 LysR family transcriptional regulator [Mangrovicoccus algicola]
MTLDQLRIFLAVAREAHVTRAAGQLHLTQSAVSSAIAALEAQHGLRLFDRIGRGIRLTEAGARFVSAAEAVLAQAESAEQMLNDLSRKTLGRLRIHASQTVASYWLPPRLVAYHAAHPLVELSLETGNTAQVAEAVMAGHADLGLVEGEVAQQSLTRQVVARDELVLVMAAGHPLAGRAIAASSYLSFPWLLREPGSGTRSEFEHHLDELGLSVGDLGVALELPSNEAILSAVAAGDCLAMLSRRATGLDGGAGGGVTLREVTWARRPERAFALLTHPGRYRTRAAAALIADLSAAG